MGEALGEASPVARSADRLELALDGPLSDLPVEAWAPRVARVLPGPGSWRHPRRVVLHGTDASNRWREAFAAQVRAARAAFPGAEVVAGGAAPDEVAAASQRADVVLWVGHGQATSMQAGSGWLEEAQVVGALAGVGAVVLSACRAGALAPTLIAAGAGAVIGAEWPVAVPDAEPFVAACMAALAAGADPAVAAAAGRAGVRRVAPGRARELAWRCWIAGASLDPAPRGAGPRDQG